MSKRALQIAVIVALVVLAFLLRSRDRLPQSPEDTVSAFFDAAGRGDDDAYLRLVWGQLRESLGNTRDQLGADAFRKDIQRSVAGIKGLAITQSNDARPGTTAIDVEIVFADRNERQRMLLLQERNGWVITSIEKATMVKPPIPYGTPVFEEPQPAGDGAKGQQ